MDVLWDCFNSNVGVRQGDVLSPLLFNIYINDITKYIGEGNAPSLDGVVANSLLYADDLVILSTDEMDLQDKLNKLVDFCDEWQLEINEEKKQNYRNEKKGVWTREKYVDLRKIHDWICGGVQIFRGGYHRKGV